MALQDISSYYNNMYKGDIWPVPVQIKRGNGLPLDQSTIFQTYESALSYAQGNAISTYSPEGKMLVQTAAYRGQYIAVVPLSGETSAYIVNNDGGLTPLATGGSADKILEKLNQEIERAKAAESEISGNLSTVSADLDTLESEFGTLTGTTLPALSGNLNSSLSVTVEKLPVAESGYEATYVVKQGGLSVGEYINIPKDKVISGAYVVNVVGKWDETKTPAELSAFEVSYNAGEVKKTVVKTVDPELFAVINNAYSGTGGGDGKYLRITVTNAEALPIYIALPELVDTYIGATTDTVKVEVNADTREISAFVNAESIGTSYLAADAVTNAKLADDAVQTENIKDANVTTAKLSDAAVTTEKVAENAITESKISADSVTTGKIKDGAVVTSKIADKNVTDAKIADSAIVERTIATNAITESKLSADSVTTSKIKDGAVVTSKIDAKAVTTEKINDAAVTSDKIAGSAVTTDKIDSKAVTNAKIADDAIDNSKIADSAVQTENIANGQVTLAKLSTDVTNYIDTAASTAESNAKSYTDSEIAKLSVADVYETKVDAAAKLTEAKSYTDTVSSAIETKITNARTDLSSYARETSSTALNLAKSYTDSEITDLSTELKGDIGTEITNRQKAVSDLSVELKGDVSTEKTRAEGVESAISGKVTELSTKFETVSADHESRIGTVEEKVAGLSSSMHFKGVNLTVELSTGSTTLPKPPYKDGESAKDGDVVIVKDNKEFVWANNQWNEFGAEGIWATAAALEAESQRAKASESTLSGMVSAEETRAKGVEGTLRTDLDSLSGKYDTFTGTTYVADKAALESTDSEISGKVTNKIKSGDYGKTLTNVNELSVIRIADEDYYKLVAEEKNDPNVVYVVSSDYVNGHDQRIINVGTAVSATDAVNLSGMNAAIETAKQQIVANSLSGVALNGEKFTVENNVAELQISCIYCGTAV